MGHNLKREYKRVRPISAKNKSATLRLYENIKRKKKNIQTVECRQGRRKSSAVSTVLFNRRFNDDHKCSRAVR